MRSNAWSFKVSIDLNDAFDGVRVWDVDAWWKVLDMWCTGRKRIMSSNIKHSSTISNLYQTNRSKAYGRTNKSTATAAYRGFQLPEQPQWFPWEPFKLQKLQLLNEAIVGAGFHQVFLDRFSDTTSGCVWKWLAYSKMDPNDHLNGEQTWFWHWLTLGFLGSLAFRTNKSQLELLLSFPKFWPRKESRFLRHGCYPQLLLHCFWSPGTTGWEDVNATSSLVRVIHIIFFWIETDGWCYSFSIYFWFYIP